MKYNWKNFMRAGGSCDGAVSLIKQVISQKYYSLAKLNKALKPSETYGYILRDKDFLEIIDQNTVNDICVYLKVAALRNYATYLETGVDTLPVYMYDGDIQKLARNPLITITNENIYFRY